MKHLFIFSLSFLLITTGFFMAGCGQKQSKTVRVSGAWALYPLMTVWAEEYNSLHQKDGLVVKVAGGGSGKGVSDALNDQVDIGMLSRPPAAEELKQGMFPIAVVKDSVVAAINKNNPVIDEIYKQGLSQQDLENIFLKKVHTWGEVVGNTNGEEITVFGRSDASGAAKTWANYLGDYTQNEIQHKADANFNGDLPLARAVKNEETAIGFNNLNFAYNVETGKFAHKIRPVPLDLNNNNQLETSEDFYGDRNSFLKAVEINRYPSPPARRIFVIARGPFEKKAQAFVNWILTDGQQYVTPNGYVKLAPSTLKTQRKYLNQNIPVEKR